MRTALRTFTLLCVCLFASAAFGQGALYYDRVQAVDGRAIGGVTVTVCDYSSGQYNSTGQYTGPIPCTSPVTAYYDPALMFAIPPPVLTDSQGNILIYLPSGTYTATYSAPNINPRGFSIVLGGSGSLAPGSPTCSQQYNAGSATLGGNYVLEATCFAGADIGAKINAAYAALPSVGGRIHVAPASGGACVNFSTPIVLATNGKYVYLEGDPSATCINYTPSSGIALSVDTGAGHQPSGMFGMQITTTTSTPTSIGLSLGLASGNGAEEFELQLNKISGFQVLVNVPTSNSFKTTFIQNVLGPCYGYPGPTSNTPQSPSNIAINVANGIEIENLNLNNNLIFQCGIGANILGQGEFHSNGDSWDDNTTAAIDINGPGLTFTVEGSHFENFGGYMAMYPLLHPAQYFTVTGAGNNIVFHGGDIGEDRTTGTQAQFITFGGTTSGLVMDGTAVGSQGGTVTQVANLSGSVSAQLRLINLSTPVEIPADYNTSYSNGRILDWPVRGDTTWIPVRTNDYMFSSLFLGATPGVSATAEIRPNASFTESGVTGSLFCAGPQGISWSYCVDTAGDLGVAQTLAASQFNLQEAMGGSVNEWSFQNASMNVLEFMNSSSVAEFELSQAGELTLPSAAGSGVACAQFDASGDLLPVSPRAACSSGGGITLATNGVNNGSQTLLNFITSSTNADGLVVTPYNSGGTEKFEITGPLYYQTFQVGGTPVTQETTANFVAGTNMTITPSIVSGVTTLTFAASATGATAFSSLTASTNSNTGNFVIVGGNWDFSSGTWRAPTGSGYAPTANGVFGYNSLTNLYAFGQNGSTLTLSQTQAPSSGTFLSGYNAATGAFSTASNAATATLAATATAAATTPTLCATGQAPTGVTVNFDATGCAVLLVNPMTTIGDMIGGGASGAASRIPGGLTGQVPLATHSATPTFASQGVSGRTVAGTTDSILCDSSTTTLDRNTTIRYTSATGAAITVPAASATGCGSNTQGDNNFTFAVMADNITGGTQNFVFTPTSGTWSVTNGSTATTVCASGCTSTTLTLTTGQFASFNSPDNTNFNVRIGAGGSGSGCTVSGTAGQLVYNNGTSGCSSATITTDGADLFVPGYMAQGSAFSTGTQAVGNLATITASNTIGNAGTLGQFIGVITCTNSPCNGFVSNGGVVTVNLDGTQSVVYNDYVCESTSTVYQSHDNGSTPCALGQQVGRIKTTAASVTTATVYLQIQGYQQGAVPITNGSFVTTLASSASASNTVSFFATAPVTGDLIDCVTSSTTCTLTDAGVLVANLVTAASNFVSGDLVQAAASNKTTSDSGIATANVVTATSAAAAANQVCVAGGATKTCSYIDFPQEQTIPAANCNNATAGNGWSIGSGGTTTCRAGTNNLGGFIAITDTSSTFAQFSVVIPEDWNSGADPYIRFQVASTDTTSAHTIIPQIKVSCSKGDGSTTDDVTFNAAHSASTVTLNTTANQFWSNSSVQMNSTDMTGCVAGALMIVQVGRATDTATNARFYSATMTWPRRLVVQAN